MRARAAAGPRIARERRPREHVPRRRLGGCALRDDLAARHHVHAVRHVEQFGQVARKQQHRRAGARERVDQPVDLRFRADIDAHRRLVEQIDRRRASEPLRERDLLLVAARQEARGQVRPRGTDVEPADQRAGDVGLAAPVHEAEARYARQVGEHDVLAHRQRERDAVRGAVFRDERDAVRDRVVRPAHARRAAVHGDAAAHAAREAEQRTNHVLAAGAEPPRQPDDLASPHRERQRAEAAGQREIARFERDRARRGARAEPRGIGAGRRAVRIVAPCIGPCTDPRIGPRIGSGGGSRRGGGGGLRRADHRRDERVARYRARLEVRDVGAVAQHAHAVAYARDLVQVVRHVEDGVPVGAQPLDRPQQPVDLARHERGARLVEHEDLVAAEQRARDLHDLLLGDGQLADQPVGRQVQAELRVQHRATVAAHALHVERQ
ncbi:ABC transporter, carbohydrate uptake transporter-2 (CUT2) family, ATP-binding domain protein [Burkholderia pseudomallei]|nr:ABC transporter, carbohydrate uptake transporter-2 (CUT2) family, ATP-binding domain protein [Burkholderia pseudomallei]